MEGSTTESNRENFILIVSILIPFLMSMFCTFSNGSLGMVMALTKDGKPQWNVDTIMVGIAMSSMTIAMAVSGLFAAFIIDKISKKPVAIVGGLMTGFSFIFLAMAWNWEIFYFATVLIGIGNGIVAPVIFALISDATPPEKRASNYGLFFLFGLAGTIYVMIFFVPQMLLYRDWQTPYTVFGIYIIVLALMVIIAKLPKRGQKDSSVQDIEYEYSLNFRDLKDIVKRKSNFWLILNFADAVPSGVNTFLIFWLTEEHNLEYSAALGLFVMVVFFGFLSPVFWGLLIDKLNKKSEDSTIKIKVCIYLLIASSPLSIIAVFIPWDASGIVDPWSSFAIPGFFVVSILVMMISVFAPGIRPIWQSTMTEINLPEHRTTSYQIAIFVDYIGTALGSFIAGYLIVWFAPYGYASAFIFSGFMGVINIFTWFMALRYYEEDKLEVENILAERANNIKSNE